MHTTHRRTPRSVLLATMLCALLAACGGKLDGSYSTNGKAAGDGFAFAVYKFKSNGTVVAETMGAEMEMKYELEDKKIRLLHPQGQGAQILTLLDDGSIQGPMGFKLQKVK